MPQPTASIGVGAPRIPRVFEDMEKMKEAKTFFTTASAPMGSMTYTAQNLGLK